MITLIETLFSKLFSTPKYVRKLISMDYRDNELTLWYGGADVYYYKNIDGIWVNHKSFKRVGKEKQAELTGLVASIPKGRGGSKV